MSSEFICRVENAKIQSHVADMRTPFYPLNTTLGISIFVHIDHLKRNFRRFAIMLTLFGTIIVFIVWIPVKFIKMVSPDFLPYRVFAISDEPLNHVSLELVTLQGNGPVFFLSPMKLFVEFY